MNDQAKPTEAVSHLQKNTPNLVELITELKKVASSDGCLDAKTKSLLLLILAIKSEQEECIIFHMQQALVHQLNLEEMQEIVAILTYMGGGPGMMAGENALHLFESLNKRSE